ncbi:peptidoglycan editing factor PgeF [Thalassotalea mangrovi]|uniref:Purine nucleoside phosphorylase n=1 Tax=Thalassotalea mangrovi TaxID=2572245 RepID=A0A4U1B3K0_9GAMM|nr:peptidoglycan editing factor PgeF [Thalassotalea mangrovi]TKB44278.1 peptidoglycan editing factor PgeF [Thalassotalea mangrovi]
MFNVNDSNNHRVKALSTTRTGGVSLAPYDSFNLGDHVGDEQLKVVTNRQKLTAAVNGQSIQWLNQVHGDRVHELTAYSAKPYTADAVYTRLDNQPISILTADCLPILLAAEDGSEIAAIHAGWRPLAAGIVVNTLNYFQSPATNVHAWLGPCIGPQKFEVGAEVRQQFVLNSIDNEQYFEKQSDGKYLANLQGIATTTLQQLGVIHITRSPYCTVSNPESFFSYRRDGQTGRMATVITKT